MSSIHSDHSDHKSEHFGGYISDHESDHESNHESNHDSDPDSDALSYHWSPPGSPNFIPQRSLKPIPHLPAEIVIRIAESLHHEANIENGEDPEEERIRTQKAMNEFAKLRPFFYIHVNPILYKDNILSGGSSALYLAVAKGDLRIVKMMIALGADIHRREVSEYRRTCTTDCVDVDELPCEGTQFLGEGNALHIAIAHERYEMAEYLLEQGMDPMAETESELVAEFGHCATPLELVIRAQNLPFFKKLVSKGADINHVNRMGHTPLQQVLMKNTWRDTEDPMDYVRFLLEQGADINIVTKEHQWLLSLAFDRARWGTRSIYKDFPRELLKTIIEAGADIHKVDGSHDWHPIHEASHLGLTDVVSMLLDRGADVNARDNRNLTPLCYAIDLSMNGVPQGFMEDRDDRWVWKSNVETVNLLLERGAATDVLGQEPPQNWEKDPWNGRMRLQWIAAKNWDPKFRAAFKEGSVLLSGDLTKEEKHFLNREVPQGKRLRPKMINQMWVDYDSDSD